MPVLSNKIHDNIYIKKNLTNFFVRNFWLGNFSGNFGKIFSWLRLKQTAIGGLKKIAIIRLFCKRGPWLPEFYINNRIKPESLR